VLYWAELRRTLHFQAIRKREISRYSKRQCHCIDVRIRFVRLGQLDINDRATEI
jgi:hypothetical protein